MVIGSKNGLRLPSVHRLPEVGQDCFGGKGYARIRTLPTQKESVSAKQMAKNHLWVGEDEDEVMPHWSCSDWD